MSRRDPFAAFRAAPDWIWRAIVFLLALAVLLLITTRTLVQDQIGVFKALGGGWQP